VLSWIEREVSRSGDEREKAYLNLLRALQHNEAQEFDSAVASFKKGFEYFGTKLPRKEIFAQAYLRAVVGVGQRHSELAKEAIRWCDSVGFDPDDEWNQDFYWVLHNSMNYERTREYCNRVVSEDPNNLPAYAFLGHIHAVHLHEGEEAERVFRRGLAIDPDDPTLHYFLADLLADQVDRKEEAELEYEKTLSHIVDSADEARVRTALASFYSNAGQHDKAAATFRRLLQLKVEPDLLNLYAWALYKANKDLYEAAQNADAGRKLAPQDIHLLHTHLAILVRMNEWHIALPLLRRWLAATSDEHLKSAWKDFVLTFQDAVSFGHATEFAKLFDAIPCSLIFDLTRRALLATTDDENATSGLSAINQDAVRELARQMRGTDVDLRFPPFE
jgi:tetratricopeptide (TPR) repeat protein